MAQVFLDDSKLVSMANALRAATETTEPLVFPEGFNQAISSLADGVKLPKLTNPASENHVLQGYEIIDENGEAKVGNIPSQVGKTITPTTSAQTVVNAGTYVTGDIIVEATEAGSGGIDTSDATATANDILAGKTAYVNGNKIEGAMIVKEYYVSNVQPSASLGNDGDLCLVRGE